MNDPNIDKIPHQCGIKIQAIYNSLKTAEKKAVDYILAFPEHVEDISIVDFASKAGCSEATIVRLSKKLGYAGFPELKHDFAENSNSEPFLDYSGIKKTDKPLSVLKKVFESTIVAINDTFNTIDECFFNEALQAIIRANKIMFCGVGDAAFVAMEAYQRFVRIGKNCTVAVDPDFQLILGSQLSRGDVFVAISHSGKSLSVINSAKQAKVNGAKIIAITNFPLSPLAKKADVVLQTAAFSKDSTGEIISKRITELCILEGLYINFLKKTGQSSSTQLKISNEAVSKNKV